MATIKLKSLITEAEDFQARSKETGKLVHFKSKDAYQSALKAGTHEDPKAKKGGKSKADVKPNDMFGGDYAKDRGGEAPKADGMATVNSIASMTGLRTQAVAGWADENGVNLSKVAADIKSKKLKPMDFMTAVSGNPGNKYAKDIIAKYSQSGGEAPKSGDWIDDLDSIDTSDIKGKADPNADSFTSADLYGAKFKDPNTGKTITVGDAYDREDDSEAYKKAFAYVAKFDPDKEAVMGTQAYDDLQKKADVKSIIKGILKTADKEFAGTHKLKDIVDDVEFDTMDDDGKDLQSRIDKGEDGIYVQTDETEGTIVFSDGTQYQLHHVEDGPIPVTKIGTKADEPKVSSKDEVQEFIEDMDLEEYENFAYDNDIDPEDANEMQNFISSLSDEEAEDILKKYGTNESTKLTTLLPKK